MNTEGITFSHVSKVFANSVTAVDDVSLEVGEGEFVVLVGPSGCGKTTLLRMLAGLEVVDSGTIEIGGADVTHVPVQKRDIAMVFQNYALYPHMTVGENLGYSLSLRRMPKDEREARVVGVAQKLGLDGLLQRRPAALSGGQRQRVAMGRAIVREPKAFLMDEPLSNLDAKLRVSMRAELAKLHERLKVTTLYVTHDQVEAMTLGQRVAVLRDGRLQQFDSPQTLFRAPNNLFVAAFMGSPAMNLVYAELSATSVSFGGYEIPLPHDAPVNGRRGEVVLGIRPTDFEHSESAAREWPRIRVQPEIVEDLGSERHVIFPVDARPVIDDSVRAANEAAADDDGHLFAEGTATFTACLDARNDVARAAPLDLAIDPRQLYFFEPSSGVTLGRVTEL